MAAAGELGEDAVAVGSFWTGKEPSVEDAGEAVGQDAAAQVAVDGLLRSLGQRPVTRCEALVGHLHDALEVLCEHAVQRGAFGVSWPVDCRRSPLPSPLQREETATEGPRVPPPRRSALLRDGLP